MKNFIKVLAIALAIACVSGALNTDSQAALKGVKWKKNSVCVIGVVCDGSSKADKELWKNKSQRYKFITNKIKTVNMDGEGILVAATKNPNAKIILESVVYDGNKDRFKVTKKVTVKKNPVLIRTTVPEVIPNLRVTVSDGNKKYSTYIWYDGKGDTILYLNKSFTDITVFN